MSRRMRKVFVIFIGYGLLEERGLLKFGGLG